MAACLETMSQCELKYLLQAFCVLYLCSSSNSLILSTVLQSSGSASESGVPKSMSVGESDNNTSSNDENDNASVGLNVRDGSDNGSGTQVCMKCFVGFHVQDK